MSVTHLWRTSRAAATRICLPGASRRNVAAITVLASVLFASACGSSNDTDDDRNASGSGAADGPEAAAANTSVAAAQEATTAYPEIEPIEGAADALEGKTVWYVPFGAAAPSIAALGDNLADSLGRLGATLQVCDGKFQPTEVASCLDKAVQQDADAVITGFVDYRLVPTAFDAVSDADIPLLVGGAPVPEGMSSTAEMAFYDNLETLARTERLTVDAVIADSGADANILYVGNTDSPGVQAVADQTVEYINEACASCEVDRVDYSSAETGDLPSLVSAGLTKNPEVDYVVAQFDVSAALIASGIQTVGKGNSVKLAASGGSLDSLQRIADGQLQFADAASSVTYVGWQWTDALLRMTAGQVPAVTPTVLRLFTADNVKDLDLTPDAFARFDWFGSTESFEKTFLSAWGVDE